VIVILCMVSCISGRDDAVAAKLSRLVVEARAWPMCRAAYLDNRIDFDNSPKKCGYGGSGGWPCLGPSLQRA